MTKVAGAEAEGLAAEDVDEDEGWGIDDCWDDDSLRLSERIDPLEDVGDIGAVVDSDGVDGPEEVAIVDDMEELGEVVALDIVDVVEDVDDLMVVRFGEGDLGRLEGTAVVELRPGIPEAFLLDGRPWAGVVCL